jgi:ribosomal protein S18 acetylase RimI-like enzyme
VSFDIRNARSGDVPGVVRAHCAAFPGFFLTLLGETFLSHLYRAFLEQQAGTLLVAVVDDDVVGFAAGTRSPQTFFRSMRRNQGGRMAISALRGLLRRPVRVAQRMIAAVRYRGDHPRDLPGFWLLSSLGVVPDHAGSGVGSALLRRFCDLAARDGVGVYLLTDVDQNDRVLGFYRRCGFVEHSLQQRPDGRRLVVIVRDATNE